MSTNTRRPTGSSLSLSSNKITPKYSVGAHVLICTILTTLLSSNAFVFKEHWSSPDKLVTFSYTSQSIYVCRTYYFLHIFFLQFIASATALHQLFESHSQWNCPFFSHISVASLSTIISFIRHIISNSSRNIKESWYSGL